MKIICFDVDMTLYDHNSRIIPESALKTIEVLRKDHKIVLTTGRDLGDDYCKEILEQVRPDAMVHCNGTRVSVGDQILLDKGYPLSFVKEIFDYALEQGFTVGALYDEKAFCTNVKQCYEPLKKFCDGVGLEIRDYKEVDIDPVFEMFYYGTEKEARMIEARFPELRLPMYATGNASDIIYKGYSKATGIQMVLDYYGKTFADVIAVGDSNNDLELLRSAGFGICMGNGRASLKEVADYVTTPIWDDGVYNAFKMLGMVD